MFDAQTAQLIRAAPAIRGVDPQTLPQILTQAYTELVSLRLRNGDRGVEAARAFNHERLLRMATIYEALVDTGASADQRRASAFVAGTAYQILGRVGAGEEAAQLPLLTALAIHPNVAAPLLFLIAEQSPDAREAGLRLEGLSAEDLLRSTLLESISDLASERFESILERAVRLQALRPSAEAGLDVQATQTLYGLCWSGIVQLVAELLDRPVPASMFRRFDTPDAVFAQVEKLATTDIALPGVGGQLVSTYSGPRHLARLLRQVARGLAGTGLAQLPIPAGADPKIWKAWVRHRTRTKPLIWPNHQPAITRGLLEPGRSAVLVLPTGAGKTTLSELKIASTLATGQKIVFLAPTLALVDQLRDDLAGSFPKDIGGVIVSTDGDLAILASGPEFKQIEVMTPERFLALLSFADADVSEVGLIVFDECHLLSPMGGGSRSLDAMLCLLHAVKRVPHADLLLLSAMITNGQEVADWLETLTGRPAEYFHDAWKPSRQARGVVIYPKAEIDPIDLYARQRRRGLAPEEPSLEATAYALFGLQHNWNPKTALDVKIVRLMHDTVKLNVGVARAAPNANGVAAALAVRAAAAKLKTIVFVQTAGHAPPTARTIARNLPGPGRLTVTEEALRVDIQIELGPRGGSLVDPAAGALPHNGDMLPLERRLAESLFRRTNGAEVIVATPTLAQGMNLPAQLAILAGDKRQDGAARNDLEQHELLNAAGRAGRAGYLANGIVLLIPEPVVSFDADHEYADRNAFEKLRTILPASDQCVRIDDPLTPLLDQIQTGHREAVKVRYLLNRLQAGEGSEHAAAAASGIVRASLAAFQAQVRATEADFADKVSALEAALAENVADTHVDAVRISAFTGLPAQAVESMGERLCQDLDGLPSTIGGWLDWLVDFLREDQVSREAMLVDDASTVTAVTRGKKVGGPTTAAEFEILKAGLQAWIKGRPFDEIELSLGAPPSKIRFCPRARDLVLKLVNRRLYLVAAAIAELAKSKLNEAGKVSSNPAVLEILAIALRKGLDSPEKAAFAHLHPAIRTRVGVHQAFDQRLGTIALRPAQSFRDVIQRVQAVIALGTLDQGAN